MPVSLPQPLAREYRSLRSRFGKRRTSGLAREIKSGSSLASDANDSYPRAHCPRPSRDRRERNSTIDVSRVSTPENDSPITNDFPATGH